MEFDMRIVTSEYASMKGLVLHVVASTLSGLGFSAA